jgi:hypothetical protein
MRKYEKQVKAGMVLLDEKVPRWRGKLDLTRLDISRSDQCVLGQVYGNYNVGAFRLELGLDKLGSLGFNGFTGPGLTLTREWKRQLQGLTGRIE